jgi:TetR/AcrR family transcriptional regulator, cholesterol catabolism regulator
VDEGLFHTADPKMSALQIFGMCNYAWTWYQPDGSQSVEEIARLFTRNILGGLANKPAEDAALDELITKAMDTVQRAPGRMPLSS